MRSLAAEYLRSVHAVDLSHPVLTEDELRELAHGLASGLVCVEGASE